MYKSNIDILEAARIFAIDAHESINQKRKYSNEPYHIHCGRVVEILNEVIIDKEVLAAAWMHDILEDVSPYNPYYSEGTMRELFGERVCNFVLELTDTKLEYGNRAARKANDRMRLLTASAEAKTIKLADLIDNFIDIQKYDPNFSIVFTRETELLLPCLSGGNTKLLVRLSVLLTDFKNNHPKKF